ncbi:polyribonucleotide nucleotidyltransferase, partial [bacterium]|nr:polyribonucleotide nucleotidyltransferase [bacterium]
MTDMMRTKTINIGKDQLILETGRIARQADGAVIVKQGNAAILVTVVSSDSPREGVDFFPLTVDYRELFGAAGVIPRSYNRREGRLSDREILSCRIIDRSLRPLFPQGYRYDTQVIATLLSADRSIDTDVLGLLGACAAIHLSAIPFDGPAAGLRLCRIDGKYIVNPRRDLRVNADIDLVISGGRSGVVMMEGHCSNVSETDVLKALETGHEYINNFLDIMDEWREERKIVSRKFVPEVLSTEFSNAAQEWVGDKLSKALSYTGKQERYLAISTVKKAFLKHMEETVETPDLKQYAKGFDKLKYDTVRNRMFEDKIRLDNRSPEEVRPITGEVDWIPTPHGSALFTRGETQACVTCTLGPERDLLKLQTVYGDEESSFFLHYSFPPYSVGEARPMRGPGRREIGHGTLAWRALSQVMPAREKFPYTTRVFSEITESNGSSSMATV